MRGVLAASLDRKGLRFSQHARFRDKLPLHREEFSLVSNSFPISHCTSKADAASINSGWTQAILRGRFKSWERDDMGLLVPYLFYVIGQPDPNPADSNEVVSEVFRGRVDNIQDRIAFVTLITQDGDTLVAQWPARDLAKKSIGKSDLFELTMTDTGESVIPSFRKIPRTPIPDELWAKIQKLKEAYPDLQADESDGEEEE
jgi:hypothetical protein